MSRRRPNSLPSNGMPGILLLFLQVLFQPCTSCNIHGTDSGICTNEYLPETYGEGLAGMERSSKRWQHGTDGPCKYGDADHCMPFCGKYIANYYPPCIPAPMSLPPDQNYPNGRYIKHTVRTKDKWIEETVMSTIQRRIDIETNETARKLGVDEFGNKGETTAIRFYKNEDCQEAYTRYFCWINFPRCDEFGESMPLCESACVNFFRTCGYEEDLWRCGKLGADEEEEELRHLSNISSFFPGSPFKRNEYIPKSEGEPKAVCTPSIKGASPPSNSDLSVTVLVIWSISLAHLLFS